jgi:hypothetical protein
MELQSAPKLRLLLVRTIRPASDAQHRSPDSTADEWQHPLYSIPESGLASNFLKKSHEKPNPE